MAGKIITDFKPVAPVTTDFKPVSQVTTDFKPVSMVTPSTTTSFKPVGLAEEQPEISWLESIGQGGLQGISLAFADEVIGFVQAAGQKLTDNDKRAFWDIYKENQTVIEERVTAARDQHPWLFGGAEIGAFILGPGKFVKGAKAITGLAMAEGLGRTTADLTTGDVEEYKKAALEVGLYGALSGAMLYGAPIVGRGIKSTAQKMMSKPVKEAIKKESVQTAANVDKVMKANSAEINEMGNLFDDRGIKKIMLKMSSSKPAKNPAIFTEQVDEQTKKMLVARAATRAERSKTIKKLQENMTSEEIAYKQLMTETEEFGRFLAAPSAAKLKEQPIRLGKRLKYFAETKQAIRQGKFNKESYITYRALQYTLKDISKNLAVKDAKAGREMIDPANNFAKSLFEDFHYILSEMDKVTGQEMSVIAGDIAEGANAQSTFKALYSKMIEELQEQAYKAKLDAGDLHKLVTDGKYRGKVWKTLPENTQNIVRKTTRLQKAMRDDLNARGANIGKLKNYAPLKAKEIHHYIKSMHKWSQDDVIAKALAQDDKVIVKSVSELDEFAKAVEHMFGKGTVTNIASLNKRLGDMKVLTRMKSNPMVQMDAAFHRVGKIPAQVQETDIFKLMYGYINDGSTATFMAQPLQALEAQIPVLKELGMKDSAEYIRRYLGDMNGVSRGLSKNIKEWRQLYNNKVTMFFKDSEGQLANLSEEAGLLLPKVFDRMAQSIYPNALGLNVAATARNSLQPFMMTGTDIGAKASYLYGTKLTGKAMAKAQAFQAKQGKNYFSAANKYLADKKLMTTVERFEAAEAVKGGYKSYFPRKLHKFISKEEEAVMFFYKHVDAQNRLTTYFMAEDIVSDAISGAAARKAGKALTGSQQSAASWMRNLDPGYKSRIARELADGNLDAVKHLTARYMINKTQLVYGRAAMHDFGRMAGPLFSMFTKWPVTVGSELAHKWQTDRIKGIGQFSTKYAAPMLGLYGLKKATDIESPRAEKIIGRDPFTYWSPLTALTDISELTSSPVIDTGLDIAKEVASFISGDKSNIQRAADRASRSYVPVYGGVRNIWDRAHTIITDEE